MKTTTQLAALIVIAGLAAGPVSATEISLSDLSLTPDGSTAVVTNFVNINTLNGGSNVLATSPSTVYVVTTFTWGTNSDAHMSVLFNFDGPGDAYDRARIGFRVNDDGLVESFNTGTGYIDYDGLTNQPKRTTVNLSQDMAGQSLTLIAKLHYDTTNGETYNSKLTNGTNAFGDDTLMNVWVNPTSASVEGAGPAAGDLYALWNSYNFKGFKQIIENQSTPGSAGASSIADTVILTGADATWANALKLVLPPSWTVIVIQ